jgi:anti-anti-sigma regulatory factor
MMFELPENLSVKNIKDFYVRLGNGIRNESEIILDFTNVRRVDLSVVQVLMAANRDFAKKGKQIKLKSVSENIKNQLHLAGFLK